MKEAARITDPVTHGDGLTTGELTNGSPNATIGGKHAARQWDDYASTCDGMPLKHLPKRDVQIAEGSRNVTINGRRAARVGDELTCGAKIMIGCKNVFIGGARVSTTAGKPEEWLATFNKEA
jgi:uncharacterized Zn-binding protein involved in type VI secretion